MTSHGATRGAGAAVIITSPTGVKYRYVARLSFALESDRCTNNIAEYEAAILGLRKLWAHGVTICIIRTYSKVVAGQIKKEYSAKEPMLTQYLTAVRGLKKQFKGFTLQHIEQNKNEEADALAKEVAKGKALPSDYHVIGTPAIRNPEGLQITQDADGHCDTPGVYFALCREIYPNLGCSVNISISLSHLSPFIKLLMNVSPNLELFDLKNNQIWSLLKLLFLEANANSKVNLVSQLPSRLIYSDSRQL
jgi:ribonuclease HI